MDAAGTTLVAAATYRLSLLRNVHKHLPQAERVRERLVARVNSDGWLAPVVNPVDFDSEGSNSPEGQAFVIQLHAAYREWDADGRKGENAASALRTPGLTTFVGVALALVAMAFC